ncbi:bifunctional N-acetylglucosamine-1-phosphate uridyltransferase/glucosamine-1-phosphate acetyltransferase [Candidatus Omnitrophota bacterium]
MRKDLAVIILAAGKGVRMKSELQKVLHTVAGRPMLGYVLDLAKRLVPKHTICVLGHKPEAVRGYIKKQKGKVKIVIQKRLLGSADAVKQAASVLKGFKGTVLVLYADNPLLKLQTVKKLINYHQQTKAAGTLLSAVLKQPKGYGRIIRDTAYNILGIVEEAEANDYEREIKEINTGICCYDKDSLFRALKSIKLSRRKKEYYLTDAVGILSKQGEVIESLKLEESEEAIGINRQSDLAQAEKVLQQRLFQSLSEKGVRIVDPDSTRVCWDTRIGAGSVVFPFTVIETNVKIGKDCSIGPFCHLRPGVVIRDKSKIGNFTEVSRSTIGERTAAKHFCFLGDSRIGKGVNIGAGTVTANYDGKKKSITKIRDQAFIGSDTILVAPLRIGRRARTGAGSVVTRRRDVPPGKTVVGVPAKPLK